MKGCGMDFEPFLPLALKVPAFFPLGGSQRFLDRQGAVHARVSADIGQEFGVYLACSLRADRVKDL